jgi:hypothetical protein
MASVNELQYWVLGARLFPALGGDLMKIFRSVLLAAAFLSGAPVVATDPIKTDAKKTDNQAENEFIQVPTQAIVVVITGGVLLLAAIAGFVFVWYYTLKMINDEALAAHRAIIVRIMMSGAPIRSITIVVIVLSVGYLTFFGKLSSEVAGSILAGIAGYVLGVGRSTNASGIEGLPLANDTKTPLSGQTNTPKSSQASSSEGSGKSTAEDASKKD